MSCTALHNQTRPLSKWFSERHRWIVTVKGSTYKQKNKNKNKTTVYIRKNKERTAKRYGIHQAKRKIKKNTKQAQEKK